MYIVHGMNLISYLVGSLTTCSRSSFLLSILDRGHTLTYNWEIVEALVFDQLIYIWLVWNIAVKHMYLPCYQWFMLSIEKKYFDLKC